MVTPEQARELVRIYDAAERVLREALGDGEWHSLDDLAGHIPANLAETYYGLSSCHIRAEHSNREASITGTFRRVLAREIIESLARQGACELQRKDGAEMVRLVRRAAATATVVPPHRKQQGSHGRTPERRRQKSHIVKPKRKKN
jgi:hypothetical protein